MPLPSMGGASGKRRPAAPAIAVTGPAAPARRAVMIDTGCVGAVSGLMLGVPRPKALLVLGHGAGAGMLHPFMEAMALLLAARQIATLRYQFPYMEVGRRAPDSRRVLTATVRAVVAAGQALAGDAPLIAGGKSMGGRMTSLAASEAPLDGVRGLVFLGFPLHAPGRVSVERGEHLQQVRLPMLFLQGTRDRLADPQLLRPLCRRLGIGATLHEIESGDHSFRVPIRDGRGQVEIMGELADTIASWAEELDPEGDPAVGQGAGTRRSGMSART